MGWPMHLATTLENELALAARFGWQVVLVLPEVEVLGERGKAIGQIGTQLNVVFTPPQVRKMLKRLQDELENVSDG